MVTKWTRASPSREGTSYCSLADPRLQVPRGGEVELQRLEKAQATHELYNKEGGVCPRPEAQDALRSCFGCAVMGGVTVHGTGSSKPPPTNMRDKMGCQNSNFPASLPQYKTAAAAPVSFSISWFPRLTNHSNGSPSNLYPLTFRETLQQPVSKQYREVSPHSSPFQAQGSSNFQNADSCN